MNRLLMIIWLPTALLLCLIISPVSAQRILKLEDVPVGASALVTYDAHDTWTAWGPEDQSLAFISSVSGSPGLYVLHLDEVEVRETPISNLYLATYLTDENVAVPIEQVISLPDKAVDGPSWPQTSSKILVRTYGCNEDYLAQGEPCGDFRLSLVDTGTKTLEHVLDIRVKHAVLGTDSFVYYVARDQPDDLVRRSIASEQTEVVLSVDTGINGLSLVGEQLLVITEDKVLNIDPDTLDATLIDSIPIVATKVTLKGNTLFYTMLQDRAPAVTSKDILTGETRVVLGSFDYEPVLSHDTKWLSFLSEGVGGIILHKLE